MKLFKKSSNQNVKKYAVIKTTSKGYTVQYRTARKVVHGGEF